MTPQETKLKYELASSYSTEGRHVEALALLEELLHSFPNEVNILRAKAKCLAELGRTKEALDLCDKLEIVHGDSGAAQLRQKLEAVVPAKPASKQSKMSGRWRIAVGLAVGAILIVAGLGPAISYYGDDSELEQTAPPPLPKLHTLDIGSNPIDNDDLSSLNAITSLEILIVADTPISDDGLRRLTQLERLRQIDLRNTNVTSQGVEAFQQENPEIQVAR